MENKLFRFTDIFKGNLVGRASHTPVQGLGGRWTADKEKLGTVRHSGERVGGGRRCVRRLTLTQLAERGGSALLGEENFKRFGTRFPLLVKFIDAAQPLSVQVHPG